MFRFHFKECLGTWLQARWRILHTPNSLNSLPKSETEFSSSEPLRLLKKISFLPIRVKKTGDDTRPQAKIKAVLISKLDFQPVPGWVADGFFGLYKIRDAILLWWEVVGFVQAQPSFLGEEPSLFLILNLYFLIFHISLLELIESFTLACWWHSPGNLSPDWLWR